MNSTEPFRALCLDGGGMRGVYTATYLNGLAQIFGTRRNDGPPDIGSAFDLICGTSTGAIVASALACGVPMERVVELYEKNGLKIFPTRVPKSAGFALIKDLLFRSHYIRGGSSALAAALELELGKITFAELYSTRKIALAIPSVSVVNHSSWVFKTPHHPNTSHRDDQVTLVDACLASTAAPVFRSIAMIKNTVTGASAEQAFVDGGLWANNPVLVALIEALELAQGDQSIEIFCLGTVPVPAGEHVTSSDVNRGLLGWGFGSKSASLSIDAQQFAYDNMARMLTKHLRRECRIYRFPAASAPASLLPFLDLDDGRPEAVAALQKQAGSDANMTNAACDDPLNDVGQAICRLFNSTRMRAMDSAARNDVSQLDAL